MSRWHILAVLFTVRTVMGFQYQSVAAVGPLVSRDPGVELADIGVLIGLYLAPGVFLALPGGEIGRRFGDKATVLAGLALMIVGGLLMAISTDRSAQVGGRLLAGTGGVLLNVLMSKMVTDWFAGREIATAMAIFVNSWPAGIAVALVLLPPVGTAFGVGAVFLLAAALAAVAMILLGVLYRSPETANGSPDNAVPDRVNTMAVVTAGLIWSFFNIGFAMVFSFGPSMLAERGWPVAAAGSAVSIMLWLAILSVPLGGLLADWTKSPRVIIVAGCLSFSVLLVVGARIDATIPVFIALGIIGGLPAGSIMSLPAGVLAPNTRAIGMGLFYTVFYLGMGAGPIAAGWIATSAGSASAAFDFGAVMLLACVPSLWIFSRLSATAAGR